MYFFREDIFSVGIGDVSMRLKLHHISTPNSFGARCSSVVRAFAHGAMGRQINPSWGGPIELFLVPASAPRPAYKRLWYVLSCLMHIKEPLLLIGKSSLCGGSGFPLSLSEWSFTICLTRR